MNDLKDKLLLFIKGSKDGSSSSTTLPKQKKPRVKKITRLHLILAGIIFVAALTVIIVIRVKIITKEVPYKEYEKILVNAANLYYNTEDIEIKDGTTERIDAKKLKSKGYVETDNKVANKCVGYVESVSQKEDVRTNEYVVTRKAYIKCGNKYKTVNYISY